MPKLVSAISLDYDGCGYILFDGNHEGIINHFYTNLTSRKQPVRIQQALMRILHDEIKSMELKATIRDSIQDVKALLLNQIKPRFQEETILFVGSNRQDQASDVYNSHVSNTISCYDAYRQFAHENGMVFCALLLGDIYQQNGQRHEEPLAIGTTMGKPRPDIEGLTQEAIFPLLQSHIISPLDRNKFILIQTQIHYLSQQYPEAERISFVFFDDRQDLLNGIRAKIEAKEFEIPANVTIELVEFDSISLLREPILKAIFSAEHKAHSESMAKGPLDTTSPAPTNDSEKATAVSRLSVFKKLTLDTPSVVAEATADSAVERTPSPVKS